MIKICHVTSAHNTDDVRIFKKECVSLAKKEEYQVYLVGPGEDRKEKNVNVVGVGKKPTKRFDRMFKFAPKVISKALCLDADIYHLHDPELLRYAIKLKKKGKKVIFDSHEYYREQLKDKPYLPSFASKTIAFFYSKYENRILNKIDALVFPCKINEKNVFENKCKQVYLIDNFVLINNNSIKCIDEKIIKKYDLIYTGSLSESRGTSEFFEIVHKENLKACLAGSFSSEEYKQKVYDMPGFSSTSYKGIIDSAEVNELLRYSKVGFAVLKDVGQYHKADNLSTKVYEYMLNGIPVVVSKTKYNEKFIDMYQCGIAVNSDNIEEISKAVRYLIDNPDIAKKMGEKGKLAVENIFNWETQEKKLYELYANI